MNERCANIINKHQKLCEPSKVEKLKKTLNKLMYLIYLNLTLKQQKQQFYTKLTHEEYILTKKHIRQYMYGSNNWGWKMYNQTKLE